MRYTNLSYRHDDEVIVKEAGEGFLPLDDDLDRYCSRLELATAEFIEFRKQLKKSTLDKKLNVSNTKFYNNHIDQAIIVASKYNVKQASLATICKT